MNMEITGILWIIPLLVLVATLLIAVKLVKGGSSILSGIIGIFLVITLVAVLLVPTIEQYEEPSKQIAPKWEYDDYYQIEGLENASGSLEVTTLGDVQYLHVKSVGAGEYTADGSTYTVTTTKAPLDVFLIAGQSNAQYNPGSELGDADPVPSPGTAYYYGLSTRPISMGNTTQAAAYDATQYDIFMSVNSDGSNRVGNIEGPFSARYYEATGHKVLTINTGVGGSSITSWIDNGVCYTFAKAAFSDAMDKVDTTLFDVSVRSFFWIQGEANVYMGVDTYVGDFTQIYNNLTTFEFNQDYKFTYALISQTRDGKNAATAQQTLADKPGIFMASTAANTFTVDNGLLRTDGLHYTQKGDNILAKDFATLCIKLWS